MTGWHPRGAAEPRLGHEPIVHLPTRSVIGWSIERSALPGGDALDALLMSTLGSAQVHHSTGTMLMLPWCPTVSHALRAGSLGARLPPGAGVTVQLPNTSDRTEFDLAVRLLTASGIQAGVDFDGDVASIVALHEVGLLATVRVPQVRRSLTPETPALGTRLGMQLMGALADAGITVIVAGIESSEVAGRLRRAGVRFGQGTWLDVEHRTNPGSLQDVQQVRSFPVPTDEHERLDMVTRSMVVDSPPDRTLDSIVGIVSRRCRTPMAGVSIIGYDRQWFKASMGLELTETSRASASCAHAIMIDGPLIVPDALADARFASNPLVLGEPYFRSYLGVPLRASNGLAFGALCAIDTRARSFDADEVAEVAALASLVTDSLELQRHRLG